MNRFPEERLAELLHRLPPAPRGWVEAAQQLPLARHDLDRIVERAEADARFRQALIEDLEAALALEGVEPTRTLVDELRKRFPAT